MENLKYRSWERDTLQEGTEMRNEPVRFIITLHKGADGASVKQDLESMAEGTTISHGLIRLGLLVGSTSQESYETLFNAQLEYRTFTVDNLNRGPYQGSDWFETRKATVPDLLQDRVSSVHLDQKVFLTVRRQTK